MDNDQIKKAITDDKIVLFMKGSRVVPQCGFSDRIINILKLHDVEFKDYDVLADTELRENIKTFSDWPTIPQLYINGKFIGGSDIVYAMYIDGELGQLLK